MRGREMVQGNHHHHHLRLVDMDSHRKHVVDMILMADVVVVVVVQSIVMAVVDHIVELLKHDCLLVSVN